MLINPTTVSQSWVGNTFRHAGPSSFQQWIPSVKELTGESSYSYPEADTTSIQYLTMKENLANLKVLFNSTLTRDLLNWSSGKVPTWYIIKEDGSMGTGQYQTTTPYFLFHIVYK